MRLEIVMNAHVQFRPNQQGLADPDGRQLVDLVIEEKDTPRAIVVTMPQAVATELRAQIDQHTSGIVRAQSLQGLDGTVRAV